MVAEAKLVNVEPDSDLAHLLDDAEDRPLILVKGDERFRVTRESTEETPKDPWANYDPDKLMEGVRAAAGSITGEEAERMKEYIDAARDVGMRPRDDRTIGVSEALEKFAGIITPAEAEEWIADIYRSREEGSHDRDND